MISKAGVNVSTRVNSSFLKRGGNPSALNTYIVNGNA